MGCMKLYPNGDCKGYLTRYAERLLSLINCLKPMSRDGKQLVYLLDKERYLKWLITMLEHGNIKQTSYLRLEDKLFSLKRELMIKFCELNKYGCFSFLPLKVKAKRRGVRYA